MVGTKTAVPQRFGERYPLRLVIFNNRQRRALNGAVPRPGNVFISILRLNNVLSKHAFLSRGWEISAEGNGPRRYQRTKRNYLSRAGRVASRTLINRSSRETLQQVPRQSELEKGPLGRDPPWRRWWRWRQKKTKTRKKEEEKKMESRSVGGIKAAVYSRRRLLPRSFSLGALLWKIEIINRVSSSLFPLFRFLSLSLPPRFEDTSCRYHHAWVRLWIASINRPKTGIFFRL